jgi:L-ascorbate metabolism protein UlaG (beta-lactamase superfamily)
MAIMQPRLFNIAWASSVLFLAACSTYHPLKDEEIYPKASMTRQADEVKVTYLGNTTILISDGKTNLLVDGFLSRPGLLRTMLWRIAPDRDKLAGELTRAGITKIDALLVGHAHHDHALDAPVVAEMTGAVVMGTESYRQIHLGAHPKHGDRGLITVPKEGRQEKFGRFVVTFRLSDHVGSHTLLQSWIEGDIKTPLKTPAHYSRFKCGDVFVIHIAHPQGNLVVTTTAGAVEGQLEGLTADVVFLGIGFLDKECCKKQQLYWRETVTKTAPDLVVPVHWDNFSKKLHKGLKPAPRSAFNVRAAMQVVKKKAWCQGVMVRVMDYGDSLRLQRGRVRMEKP